MQTQLVPIIIIALFFISARHVRSMSHSTNLPSYSIFTQIPATPPTTSTQSIAKTVASERRATPSTAPFFVSTPHQPVGSGTNSRSWFPSPSNSPSCYVTLGVHQSDLITGELGEVFGVGAGAGGPAVGKLDMKGVVLFPLFVANVIRGFVSRVAEEAENNSNNSNNNNNNNNNNNEECSTHTRTQYVAKWPNDLLKTVIDKEGEETTTKVGGVLIQLVDDFFLIGIGINLFDAPTLLTASGDGVVVGETVEESFRGREAGCLFGSDSLGGEGLLGEDRMRELQEEFVDGLVGEFEQVIYRGGGEGVTVTLESILEEFETNMYRGEKDVQGAMMGKRTLEIRRDGKEGNGNGREEKVVVKRVERDGGLRVVREDGEETVLYSDYLL